MRRIFITLAAFLAIGVAVATAGTFPLTDGTKIVGTIDSIADKGVVFNLESGDYSPRIEWGKFTPEALNELQAEAKTPVDKARLQPLIESIAQAPPKAKEITIKPVEPPPRPKHGVGIFGLFGSPVGWLILLALYGANLFAAYEVCIYRHHPAGTVCGLAAIPFFGVLSPIIYGAMPTRIPPPEEPVATAAQVEEAAVAAAAEAQAASGAPPPSRASKPLGSTSAPAAAPAPAPVLPEPVVFLRSEFSFNRRFFETKFSGFFRVIPTEKEKDLVLVIKASRGEFVGTRVARITPNELYLQVTTNGVSAEEMIPFAEINEAQIRHKDSL
jgi:hypothetical protein